ncbi:hypothetical protein F0A17_01905 [Billgrantia pellis]|uniref:Phage protein n=1 Tax=Billgrantia pellis TaxID=2606936 RepID=A0A7V7G2L9_9GAMM|nr:hypothetical protein [Halomonas pellis]KAA0014428.1 hypothetical protein F0A17_01905 [Halomonas pellis]
MNADTQISLDELHQAILDQIAAAFPELATVADYPDDRQRILAPAALIELTSMPAAPDDDPGTGQLALELQFELRYVVGFRGDNQGRVIRRNTAALAHFIQHNQWELPVEPARVLVCEPDVFSPELDQYHVWRIEWAQIVHIGANEWIDDGETPTEVWVGVSPLIGPENEEFYTRQDGSQYEEGSA